MSNLKFRNLTVSPSDPVEEWGVEGIATAIDRGSDADWGRIIRAITADPYGEVALDLEQALEIAESPGIRAYLSNKLAYAREDEKARFARKFRRWVRESGMTRAELAEYLGTSRSRLSTYESGKVTPSAITAEKVRMLGVNRRKYLAP